MPKATRERTKNLFILLKSQEGCFGFLHHGCFAGVKKEDGPNPIQCLLHRGKGVPLKGPFLGHFSQGNLSKVNENVHFSDFRMFCYFDPVSVGYFSLLRLVLLTPIFSPIQGPHRNDFLPSFIQWKGSSSTPKTGEGTKNGGRRYGRLPPMVWMHAHVPTPSRSVAKIAFEKGLLVLVSSTHHCASTSSLSTSWSLTAL